MFQKISLLVTVFITLVSSVISGVFVWWLSEVYNRPDIKYFSREYYYKTNDASVGNVYLINVGRKTEKNIALTLDSAIKPEDIKIIDLTSDYRIKNNDDKTIILINELKIGEQADITFKDDPKREVFSFDITSDSSNIAPIYEQKWWHFDGLIAIVITCVLLILSFSTSSLITYLYYKKRAIKINKVEENIKIEKATIL